MSDVQAKKMWLPEAMELMQDLRVENEALQARIEELEKKNQHLDDMLGILPTSPEIISKIKAEGIREMVGKVKKDYYNPVTETTTDLIEMDEALEYADKLEKI